MWSSRELKERAKIALSGTYWKAFAVSLILTFASGGGGGSSSSGYRFGGGDNSGIFGNNSNMTRYYGLIIVFILIFLVVVVIMVALTVFIGYPLQVGAKKYFVEAAEVASTNEQAPFNLLGFGFKGVHYISIVKTMFLKGIYLFLWFLCLIIPGIVKQYAYAMVPYILADNPLIGSKRAIELSKHMTDGEKLDMFILDLSFIGWWLLGLLACGVGVLFVSPYYNSTHAELYRTLREKAFEDGLCTFEELGFSQPEVIEEKF